MIFGRIALVAWLAIAVAGCQSSSTSELSASGAYAVSDRAAPPSGKSARSTKVGSSTAPNSSKRYFIEFRSRFAYTYGHAYVVFGQLDARGRMVKPEVAGLAPKSDDPSVYMAGHVLPVEASTGWTDGDLEPEYMSAYWRVPLTEKEYRSVVADIRRLQASSPLWHASLYNCNAFVGDIARSMGYRTPFHWLVPQEYITKLRKMNGGPNAIGWTRPTDKSNSTSTKAR